MVRIKFEDRLTAFLTNFLLFFGNGWFLMLAVGVAHHEWWPALPTIGYWWAVLLCWLLRASFGRVTAKQCAEDRQQRDLRRQDKALRTATEAVVSTISSALRDRAGARR